MWSFNKYSVDLDSVNITIEALPMSKHISKTVVIHIMRYILILYSTESMLSDRQYVLKVRLISEYANNIVSYWLVLHDATLPSKSESYETHHFSNR